MTETFTHIGDDGSLNVVNVTLLQLYLQSCGQEYLTHVLVTKEDYDYVMQNGGVEKDNLDRITRKMLNNPIIFICEGDHQMLADGVHRYCKAFQLGKKDIPCYMVPENIWQPYANRSVTKQEIEQVQSTSSGRVPTKPELQNLPYRKITT
jgi:hypothetical protein